ncbi:hypothetical protein BCR36DRAFT_405494 [Piromyces finnis]|uniref:Uncharacterized protein n=1 Tax=Piromyces finnis TaxID=1754191 RepID=A0A1Y1V476_9FUNG|nr:hypothetical protein BCR36DRAFT_405494 [Piromyces finnis]|eukprot:ORX46888.1 hypothetical protein BCR36DRAFT_405494 [Piromyces finnis]
MNRINFHRLFRGNDNSSQRNNSNISNFSLPFEISQNIDLYGRNLASNDRNLPDSDSENSLNSNGDNLSTQIRTNETRTHLPNEIHLNNSNTQNLNENSLNNIYNSENNTPFLLDPIGRINEICIANINNKCKFGNRCRFIHGTPCSLCQQNVYNPLKEMSLQVKKHSELCLGAISNDNKDNNKIDSNENEDEQNNVCSICLENIIPPAKFGVLCNCNHYFCYDCIKMWRNSQDFSDINNHLKCPLCKTKSQFIIPSEKFPKNETERKLLITEYKQELANTECRKLRETNYKFCPYGDNCIYSHYKPDGQYARFSYLNTAIQFISPEEYDQNIVQNDIDGTIQYFNDRFIEEALLVDDGDDYGMHNGVFTNPFYHSDNSFDSDLLLNGYIQNQNFIPSDAHGNIMNNEYMLTDVINEFSELNFEENDNNNDNDNNDVSDISDSDISDYLDEIDEDLNQYFMTNNRNANSNSSLNNYNLSVENMHMPVTGIYSNQRISPSYRYHRTEQLTNLTNTNTNTINNSNNNINSINFNNSINENNINNNISNPNNPNNNSNTNNSSNSNNVSTLNRDLNDSSNNNESFDTFGIVHEDSRNMLQSSILTSTSRSSRNTKSHTISLSKDALSDNENNGISNSIILNDLSVITSNTTNSSISNDPINSLKQSRKYLGNKNKNNDNKDIQNNCNSNISINELSNTKNSISCDAIDSLKRKTTENNEVEEVESKNSQNDRIDSTSSIGNNLHTFDDHPVIPPINLTNSVNSKERLPQRDPTKKHFYNNRYYGSNTYTSHNTDFEMESTFSSSLTSSSSFIGEDEIYAKYYHQHESPGNDQYFSSSIGSKSGVGTVPRSKYSSFSRSSQHINLSSQNTNNSHSSFDSTSSNTVTINKSKNKKA